MARSDQTQAAVLGGLSVMPMTGYALRNEIRDTLGHFWSESFGQIYPALAELERQGLVERRGAERTGSSTFAITPAGTARLLDLLSEPAQPSPPRNGLLLRLFFGRQLGPAACRTLVQRARQQAEQQLAQLQAVRRELRDDREHAADSPYWLLTVSAGEHTARATIAWADETLAALAELAAEDGDSPPPSSPQPTRSNHDHALAFCSRTSPRDVRPTQPEASRQRGGRRDPGRRDFPGRPGRRRPLR